ncbi:MAG: FAD-dependent oxidoreductase [Candidatus Aminicenantes bacterium]|nr:FAD-dependent oxidoreductase [Candidatus Aminicenantes bacterium]
MRRAKVEKVKTEILIAGGGIAGLAAASVLIENGKDFILVDEYPFLGGQFLRHNPLYRPMDTPTRKKGFELMERLANEKRIWKNTLIVGYYEETDEVALVRDGKPVIIKPEKILIATGAREKFLPFPGWTLPEVISAGAVQALIKTSGFLPAEDAIFAGTGPFLLAVAYEFAKAGGKVIEIAELNPLSKLMGFSSALIDLEKAREGFKYLLKLFGKTTFGWRIERVEKSGEKLKVVFEKKGRRKIRETSLLAIGYGFVPNIEFAQLCGCPVIYDASLGGWVLKTDDELRCSENIYAAGEVTGIGGARKALIEGELAALILSGKRDDSLKKKRAHEMAFAKKLNSTYSVPENLWLSIPDETIICRCEDVTMKEIKEAAENDFVSLKGIKVATRAGLGNCQGRTCFPIITEFLRAKNISPEPVSIRPPIKPIDVGVFVDLE